MLDAYRITGDKKWQDLSWEAFKSIRKYCKAKKGAKGAFTAINAVNDVNTTQIGELRLLSRGQKSLMLSGRDTDSLFFYPSLCLDQITDDSESFLYAELFKYLYLIQADPSVVSLDGKHRSFFRVRLLCTDLPLPPLISHRIRVQHRRSSFRDREAKCRPQWLQI